VHLLQLAQVVVEKEQLQLLAVVMAQTVLITPMPVLTAPQPQQVQNPQETPLRVAVLRHFFPN